jgi:hypothetical protein
VHSREHKNLLLIWFALILANGMYALLIYLAVNGVWPIDPTRPILPSAKGEFWLVAIAAFLSAHGLIYSFVYRHLLQRVERPSIETVRSAYIKSWSSATTVSLWGLLVAYTIQYQYFFVFLILGLVAVLLHYPVRRDVERTFAPVPQDATE